MYIQTNFAYSIKKYIATLFWITTLLVEITKSFRDSISFGGILLNMEAGDDY